MVDRRDVRFAAGDRTTLKAQQADAQGQMSSRDSSSDSVNWIWRAVS
jgi:hypothetical protein